MSRKNPDHVLTVVEATEVYHLLEKYGGAPADGVGTFVHRCQNMVCNEYVQLPKLGPDGRFWRLERHMVCTCAGTERRSMYDRIKELNNKLDHIVNKPVKPCSSDGMYSQRLSKEQMDADVVSIDPPVDLSPSDIEELNKRADDMEKRKVKGYISILACGVSMTEAELASRIDAANCCYFKKHDEAGCPTIATALGEADQVFIAEAEGDGELFITEFVLDGEIPGRYWREVVEALKPVVDIESIKGFTVEALNFWRRRRDLLIADRAGLTISKVYSAPEAQHMDIIAALCYIDALSCVMFWFDGNEYHDSSWTDKRR